jgi:hypothetical protein
MSIILFTEAPKAIFMSNTYKQGVYDITDINEVKATAMLITPNTVTSLIIIDPSGNQVFYKKFDTVNEVITLGTIKDDDLVAIIGKGEIAITINK